MKEIDHRMRNNKDMWSKRVKQGQQRKDSREGVERDMKDIDHSKRNSKRYVE